MMCLASVDTEKKKKKKSKLQIRGTEALCLHFQESFRCLFAVNYTEKYEVSFTLTSLFSALPFQLCKLNIVIWNPLSFMQHVLIVNSIPYLEISNVRCIDNYKKLSFKKAKSVDVIKKNMSQYYLQIQHISNISY